MHLSNVTHLSGINYTAVDLPAILSPLNRKSMSHFPTLIFVSLMLSVSCILPSFINSFGFWSFHHFCLPLCCCLFLLLSSGHSFCLALCLTTFSSPLNGSDLCVSLCVSLLSLVSMGTVPGCHGDSAGRVMLSHILGLSRSLSARREICKAQDAIKLSPFLL